MATAKSTTIPLINTHCSRKRSCQRCFMRTLLCYGYDITRYRHYYKHPKQMHTVMRYGWDMDTDKKTQRYRQRTYGLQPKDYDMLLESQEWRCALCRQLPPMTRDGRQRTLHIDHDHSTGKIRGLLCPACNSKLGIIEKQGSDWVKRAQVYLALHGAIVALQQEIRTTEYMLAIHELQHAVASLHTQYVFETPCPFPRFLLTPENE